MRDALSGPDAIPFKGSDRALRHGSRMGVAARPRFKRACSGKPLEYDGAGEGGRDRKCVPQRDARPRSQVGRETDCAPNRPHARTG